MDPGRKLRNLADSRSRSAIAPLVASRIAKCSTGCCKKRTVVASVFAGVGGYLSVRFLVRWLRTRTLTPFAVYCLALGLGSIVYLSFIQ